MPIDPVVELFDRMQVDDYVNRAAQKYGVDPAVVHGIIKQESGYKPRAVSPVGAQGLMQLMPATAKELGVQDPFNPEQNIDGGTRYIASLLKHYNGDQKKALAAYNAGMGNVDKGRAASFPETQNYVTKVSENIAGFKPQPQAQKWDSVDLTAKPEVNPEEPDVVALFDQMAGQQKQSAPPPFPKAAPAPEQGFFSKLVNHPIDTIAEELPVVGGAIGGFFGGVPGAAAGGAAGKGYRDVYQHATELPGAIKDVVGNLFSGDPSVRDATVAGGFKGYTQGGQDAIIQGAIQGATEGAGQIVGGAIKAGGKGLIKRAFKPSADALNKTPGLLEKIASEGINPTAKGIETMDARTTGARQFAEGLVHDAGQTKVLPNGVKVTPKNIPPEEVLDALYNHPYGTDSVLDTIRGRAHRMPLLEKLFDYSVGVHKDNPLGFGYDELLKIRRGEGSAAHDIFEGIAGGNPALTKEVAAGMEAGSRKALERRVPGFAEANDVTQGKLRVLEAVREAVKKHEASTGQVVTSKLRHVIPGVITGAATANPLVGAATWAATEALTNPSVEATLGRAALKTAPVAAAATKLGVRSGEVAAKEKPRARKATSKKKVDALYSRYRQQGGE